MKSTKCFGVIGAGPGGQGIAAMLAAGGSPVAIYFPSWSDKERKKFHAVKRKGIKVEGALSLEAKPELVSEDLEAVVDFADIILVVTPAMAHAPLARSMARYLRDGQTIILNPGRTGGAFEVQAELMRQGTLAKVVVGETSTLLFTGRLRDANQVLVAGTKKHVTFATLPARMTATVAGELSGLCEFKPVESVLVTSLENLGPAFHVVGMLLNTGAIERRALEIYYRDGVTPAVARVMEQVDAERIELAKALGVNARSALSVVSEGYEIRAAGLYEAIQGNSAYQRIGGVPGLDYRYLSDDVPASVVPMVALSRAVGLQAPLLSACVWIASAVLSCDFWSRGRTLRAMGLEGMGRDEIRHAALAGFSGSLEARSN